LRITCLILLYASGLTYTQTDKCAGNIILVSLLLTITSIAVFVVSLCDSRI